MKVFDPLLVFADEGNRITTSIGVVTGVQRKTNERRVRVVQELFDLGLVLNMRVGVRMEDQAQAELPGDELRPGVSRVDQKFSRILIERGLSHQFAGVLVGIHVIDENKEFSAQPGK